MFITDKARFEDYEKDLKIVLDNIVYLDKKTQSLYLAPRNFVTDLYSIPNGLAWLVGDSAGRDCRPAIIHDFGCAYHKLLKVELSPAQLARLGYLHKHHSTSRNIDVMVCEDIPEQYLSLVDVTKGSVNDLFGRMMNDLKLSRRKLIRAGVAFNFNFYWSKKDFDWNNLYKIDNHYKR